MIFTNPVLIVQNGLLATGEGWPLGSACTPCICSADFLIKEECVEEKHLQKHV